MLGEQRYDLVAALARALFDERPDLKVLARAYRLRQHLVGDIANQDVLEGELLLVGQPRAFTGNDDVLLAQRRERRLQVTALGCRHRRKRTLPEGSTDDRRVRDEMAL